MKRYAKSMIGLFLIIFSLPCCSDKNSSNVVVITDNPVLQNSFAVYEYCDVYLSCNTNAIGVLGLLNAKQVMTIVDVRDKKSYDAGHIPMAINLPFSEYDSFEGDEVEFPQLKKDRFTYVYCYEEFCNLAHRAAKKFASLGYPVKIVRGGYESWVQKGYPVERS